MAANPAATIDTMVASSSAHDDAESSDSQTSHEAAQLVIAREHFTPSFFWLGHSALSTQLPFFT